jgi:hypothetical protein
MAWEDCNRYLCKIIEVVVNDKNEIMVIKVKKISKGDVRYFESESVYTAKASLKKYITIWPYGRFLVYGAGN